MQEADCSDLVQGGRGGGGSRECVFIRGVFLFLCILYAGIAIVSASSRHISTCAACILYLFRYRFS
jgi:hypothetical protein